MYDSHVFILIIYLYMLIMYVMYLSIYSNVYSYMLIVINLFGNYLGIIFPKGFVNKVGITFLEELINEVCLPC